MELMCFSVSFCVCVAVAPGNGVPGQTVIGRPSDRVTEHIKHTHTQTFVCLLAQQQPHRNIPVGANQMPPWPPGQDGATPVKNERELEVKWGHKKVKK